MSYVSPSTSTAYTSSPPLAPLRRGQTPSPAFSAAPAIDTLETTSPTGRTLRFGSSSSDKKKTEQKEGGFLNSISRFFRKVVGGTLMGLAGMSGFITVPLGLTQVVLGIFFHPLLITGGLTIGASILGFGIGKWIWPSDSTQTQAPPKGKESTRNNEDDGDEDEETKTS